MAKYKVAPRRRTGRRTTTRRGNTRGNRAPIQRVLRRLSEAVTAGDGRAAANCFEYPTVMIMKENNTLMADKKNVANFFAAAPEQYHDRGIYDTRAEIQDLEWLAPGFALVRTYWPFLDSEGNEVGGGENSIYIMRVDKNDATICGIIGMGTDPEQAMPRPASRRVRPRISM